MSDDLLGTSFIDSRSEARWGYESLAYAESFAEQGSILRLPRSEGLLLLRQIPGSEFVDARALYPFFVCRSWQMLAKDLEELDSSLVSVSLVTDPFGDFVEIDLKNAFPDWVRPYKEHFAIDLSLDPRQYVATNHRRNVRKAIAHDVLVDVESKPLERLDAWCALYESLVVRHKIRGVTSFSRQTAARQLVVPGIELHTATLRGALAGAVIWYVNGAIGYYHLAAYSHAGYESCVSFLLFWFAIRRFASMGLRWLALGGGAGRLAAAKDGLVRFKRGWATHTRQVWVCGRIVDHHAYAVLASQVPETTEAFFPRYRSTEDPAAISHFTL